jgi:hypothetical protein
MSLFSNHPILRIISALRIIGSISEIAKSASISGSTNLVAFPTTNPKITGSIDVLSREDLISFTTPHEVIEFAPGRFLASNNVSEGDEKMLNALDAKILFDYGECSEEVLNSGEGNFIKQLEGRALCLELRGYDSNTINYVKIKYESY